MDFRQYVQYLYDHYLEILGTITGLVYVIYSIRQKRILWIYGGLSSLFYIVVFYRAGLLAYMSLYFYYVGISIYGWYTWAPSQEANSPGKGRISRLRTRSWPAVLLIITLLFLILWFILKSFDRADLLWADALLTSGSIVATWLLMRKVIDHWWLWIVIDMLSAVVSIYKGLPFAAILFFIYTLLAIKGYSEWKKELSDPVHP